MTIELNKICDCGAELEFNSNIDNHIIEDLIDDKFINYHVRIVASIGSFVNQML